MTAKYVMLQEIREWIARAVAGPKFTLSSPVAGRFLGSNLSRAGTNVTRKSTLSIPAIKRAVSLIANAIARMPPEIFSKGTNGSREKLTAHVAYGLIKNRPSPLYSRFTWLQAAVVDVCLHGNHYSWIVRKRFAVPVEILRCDPETTRPVMVEGQLKYSVLMSDGSRKFVDPLDMIHFRGLGDNLLGLSLIDSMADSVGLAQAMIQYTSVYFRNGASPKFIVEMDVPWKSKEEENAIKDQFAVEHQGIENAHRAIFLKKGMSISPIAVSNQDTELVELRKMTLIDLANAVGLDASKLGAAINTSYKSLFEVNKAFLQDLEWLLVMMESELDYKLLTEEEKAAGDTYIEFNRSELQMEGKDVENDIWVAKLNNGLCTLNEYFQANNLPTIADEKFDWHKMPENLTFVEAPEPEPAPPSPQGPAGMPAPDAPGADQEPEGESTVRYRQLLAINAKRGAERIKRAIEGRAGKPFLDAYLDSAEFLRHRDVIAESMPGHETGIDDWLADVIERAKKNESLTTIERELWTRLSDQ